MKQTVMIYIDALLDTRLASIAVVNQEWAVQCLQNGWDKRVSNDYTRLVKDIDMAKVNAVWEKRDVEVLGNAVPTNIYRTLVQTLTKIQGEVELNPRVDNCSLLVNVWPYNLTKEEQQHVVEAVSCFVPVDVPINTCSVPPEQLTGSYMHDNIAAVFFECANRWFEHFEHSLDKVRCPKVNFFVPRLYLSDNTPEDPKAHENMFDLKSFLLIPTIALNWLPVEAYCANVEM